MTTNKNKQEINLQVTDGLSVAIIPNQDHEFTLPTKEVARGYGVTVSTVHSQKQHHADEIIEGKHFITAVQILDNGKPLGKQLLWTKAGIIRLGFFIKSEQAKLFRTWAEALIFEKIEKPKADAELIRKAVAVSGSQNKLSVRLGISSGELSMIINGDNRVSREAVQRTEQLCTLIVEKGNDFSREAYELLMQIDARDVQKKFHKLLKKGGLL